MLLLSILHHIIVKSCWNENSQWLWWPLHGKFDVIFLLSEILLLSLSSTSFPIYSLMCKKIHDSTKNGCRFQTLIVSAFLGMFVLFISLPFSVCTNKLLFYLDNIQLWAENAMEWILHWHRSKLMARSKHAGDVDDVVKDLKFLAKQHLLNLIFSPVFLRYIKRWFLFA